MNNLKRIHVVFIALGLGILFGAGFYYMTIKNVQEEIQKTTGELTTVMGAMETGRTADDNVAEVYQRAKTKAEDELRVAKEEFLVAQMKLDEYRKRYRSIRFRNESGGLEDVWPQLLAEYRDRLIPDFIAFVRAHDCEVQIPPLGEPPRPPITLPRTALLPVPDGGGGGGNAMGGMGAMMAGSAMGGGGMGMMGGGGGGGGSGSLPVVVTGTYASISNLLRRLPAFSRLTSISPVSFRVLDPTSDQIEASFSITFYLIADAPPETLKKVMSEGAGGGAAAAMGGGGGGPMGGMMSPMGGGPMGAAGGGATGGPGGSATMSDPANVGK
jgi:hypothetical protein